LIEVTAVDNAGNSYFLSDVVYKDTDIPVVTDFSFVPSASDGVKSTSQFIDFWNMASISKLNSTLLSVCRITNLLQGLTR